MARINLFLQSVYYYASIQKSMSWSRDRGLVASFWHARDTRQVASHLVLQMWSTGAGPL